MATLQDTVRAIVQDFISKEVLFTALDVSNAVKQQMPHTKHREVRDEVRAIFASDIESQGWARTPITVNLEDGSSAEALLYHPLTDSWDLDNKYGNQARSSASFRPAAAAAATVSAAQAQATAVVSTPAPVVQMPPTARDQWASLFSTQPSLFPSRS